MARNIIRTRPPKAFGALRRTAEPVTAVVTSHRQVVTGNTEFSCQGEHDMLAHICFTHAADASRFTQAPGDLQITLGESRAWVDFPAHLIGELTRFWSS